MSGRSSRSSSSGWRRAALWAPLLLLASAADALSRADEPLGFERTPPRLSFTDGAVSFYRAGDEEWTPARVNTALASGDALFAAEASNLEVQIGPRAFLRAGEQTDLELTSLEPDFLQLRVASGTASLDLRSLKPGQTLQVDAPNATFTIERTGYYRIGVAEDVTTFSSRRGGQASATTPTGEATPIAANEQLLVRGTVAPQLESYAAPELDAWDRWNYARSEAGNDAVSARYVPSDVYGVDELDRYGDWRVVPTYGALWVPRAVPAGWVPYSTGRWMYDPYYTWTWVDDAPWGWAPYHYGRWVYTSGFWGWCPGPRVARAYYSPALVAFYGGGVSVGISFSPLSLGWVALGWGEPLYPWWGPSHFRGHAHWAGWGGPHHHRWARHDDHDHGHDHGRGDWDGRDRDHGRGDWDGHDRDRDGGHRDWNDRDGRRGDRDRDHRGRDGELHVYENARVKGAIVSVDREHFGRRSERASFRRARSDEMQPLRGDWSIEPERRGRLADARPARRPTRHADATTGFAPSARLERADRDARRSDATARTRHDDATARTRRSGATARDTRRADLRREETQRADTRRLDVRRDRERRRPPSPSDGETLRRNPPGFAGNERVARLPGSSRAEPDDARRSGNQRSRRRPPLPDVSAPASAAGVSAPPDLPRAQSDRRGRPDRDRLGRAGSERRERAPAAPRASQPQASRRDRHPERSAAAPAPPRADAQPERASRARADRRADAQPDRRADAQPDRRAARASEPRAERSAERQSARAERSDRSARQSDASRQRDSDGARGGRGSGRRGRGDEVERGSSRR